MESRVENAYANKLLQHFIHKSNDNSFFSWDVDFDHDVRILHFFFRDAKCDVDFEAFGDVISIDITYKTNKYNLVCALFIVIYHHACNTILGMRFLSVEYSEWLFKTFLHFEEKCFHVKMETNFGGF